MERPSKRRWKSVERDETVHELVWIRFAEIDLQVYNKRGGVTFDPTLFRVGGYSSSWTRNKQSFGVGCGRGGGIRKRSFPGFDVLHGAEYAEP